MDHWKSVVAVLLGLLLSAPVCAAADDLFSLTPTPAPVNQTLQPWPTDKLMSVGESTERVITLVQIRSNSTGMPGPRDMAFGPTWISIVATPFQLTGAFLLVVVAALAGLFLFRGHR